MRVLRIGLSFILTAILALAFAGEPVRATPQSLSLTYSNPYCVQTALKSGTCLIKLRYAQASTTDMSFSHIEVSINGKVRAYVSGFFENSAYLDTSMLGGGLQVACGRQNVSGIPDMGQEYTVGLTAFATDSSSLVDTANVICPYYEGKVYLPIIRK